MRRTDFVVGSLLSLVGERVSNEIVQPSCADAQTRRFDPPEPVWAFDRLAPIEIAGRQAYQVGLAYSFPGRGPMFCDQLGPIESRGELSFITSSPQLIFREQPDSPVIARIALRESIYGLKSSIARTENSGDLLDWSHYLSVVGEDRQSENILKRAAVSGANPSEILPQKIKTLYFKRDYLGALQAADYPNGIASLSSTPYKTLDPPAITASDALVALGSVSKAYAILTHVKPENALQEARLLARSSLSCLSAKQDELTQLRHMLGPVDSIPCNDAELVNPLHSRTTAHGSGFLSAIVAASRAIFHGDELFTEHSGGLLYARSSYRRFSEYLGGTLGRIALRLSAFYVDPTSPRLGAYHFEYALSELDAGGNGWRRARSQQVLERGRQIGDLMFDLITAAIECTT